MSYIDIERPEMVQVLPAGAKEPIYVAKVTQERWPDDFPLYTAKTPAKSVESKEK